MRKRSGKRATQRKVDAVLEYLRAGHTIPYACRLAGLNPSVIYKRIERSPKFAALVEQAETEAIDLALQNVRNKLREGDIRVSMWVLERRLPEVWGRMSSQSAKPIDIEPEFVLVGGERE